VPEKTCSANRATHALKEICEIVLWPPAQVIHEGSPRAFFRNRQTFARWAIMLLFVTLMIIAPRWTIVATTAATIVVATVLSRRPAIITTSARWATKATMATAIVVAGCWRWQPRRFLFICMGRVPATLAGGAGLARRQEGRAGGIRGPLHAAKEEIRWHEQWRVANQHLMSRVLPQ